MTAHVSAKSGFGWDTGAAASWSVILWLLWIALLAAGLYGVALRFTYGHQLAGYGSYVPWGLWIGLYFLAIGMSGGAFVLGAVGYILDLPGFGKRSELRLAIVLSVAALIPAFIGVALDLGHTWRLFSILTSPTFTSMMAFNAWMYNIFLVVAAVCWLLSFARDSLWLKPLLVLGAFMSVLFPSQSGVFFEAVRTNDFWHSPILSVLFLASAIALGGAGLLLVRALIGPERGGEEVEAETARSLNLLRIVVIVAIVVYEVFEFAEYSIAFWSPGAHSPNVVFLLFGDYWPVFWLLHILLGVIVPLVLLLTASKGLWALGAFLAVVGFAAARMTVLVPGQIAGQIPGLQAAFQDVRLAYHYSPTAMEYLVGCFMVAVGTALLYVGIKLNRLLAQRAGLSV
ncbi:MAG: polysulfide reductase NrfD [Desulfomonile sp.]|nr:polysulfide reductase NrfD [Desulfomonile sp.]